MTEIIQSATFHKWLSRLKDRQAVARINARLRRASSGHLGDVKSVGDGVSEMRVNCGPGYRLYFLQQGTLLIVMLAGGDKSSQRADIRKAVSLAQEWREENG